jgi:hypothetical protein
MKIAIIGAGLSGATLYDYFMGKHLQSAYLSATRLYDKQFR